MNETMAGPKIVPMREPMAHPLTDPITDPLIYIDQDHDCNHDQKVRSKLFRILVMFLIENST